MAYKDILVVADDTPEGGKRAQYAIRLAARHEAHVKGMMLRDDLSFAGYAAADVFSTNLNARREAENTAHARVREAFEHPCLASSGTGLETGSGCAFFTEAPQVVHRL
ncbi:MAG: hypothetical protein J4F47_10970, partial [Alphaproteobacteria bacterium]|nr:hypothetical protein [Alphaproteobacteria bacterium]